MASQTVFSAAQPLTERKSLFLFSLERKIGGGCVDGENGKEQITVNDNVVSHRANPDN